MRQAGASPTETLLVGDSPVDAHTARICVARYGFGYVPAEACDGALYIDDPEGLAARLFA